MPQNRSASCSQHKNVREENDFTNNILNKYSADFHMFFTSFTDNMNLNKVNCDSDFKLANLNNSNNSNLLMHAVETKESLTLIAEILHLPFDINQKSNHGKTAADMAWESKNFEVLLQLLEANSTFPNDFYDYKLGTDESSEKIKKFLKIANDMHDAISSENFDFASDLIKEKRNLRYFYNSSNVSAATAALNAKNIEAYAFLLENECSIGPNENLIKIIENADKKHEPDRKKMKFNFHKPTKSEVEKMKEDVSNIHDDASKPLLEMHLLIHCANSQICHDDQHRKYRFKVIRDAFESLNKDEYVKQILQLTSMHKNFKIYFDFNRSSTHFMNPYYDDERTQGSCGNDGIKKFYLYIAAKELLLDDADKLEALATMAHELCHFAIALTFCNNGKPYAIDDEVNKVKFNRIIETFNPFQIPKLQEQIKNTQKLISSCENHRYNKNFPHCKFDLDASIAGYKNEIIELEKKIEKILRASKENASQVFYNYHESVWPDELIVRVPQMMIRYRKDTVRLNELAAMYKELFDYYFTVVAPKMKKTFPILAYLFDNSIQSDLTDAYKALLRHSKVDFQGVKMKFNKIIKDENSEIFQQLNSDQIREILIESNSFKIGCAQMMKKKFYIKREFVDIDYDRKNVSPKYLIDYLINFDQIASIAVDTRMILLSDHAGAGKTTTFEQLSLQLKQKFRNYWISYIDLKRHLKVYRKYENKINILEILNDILAFDDKIDAKIFKCLFNCNKVILLFDGVDEIAPNFKDFFMKLIDSIQYSTHNQQWIATRPQHVSELKEKFEQNAYKLLPYNNSEKNKLIRNVLKNSKVKNVRAEDVLNCINEISYKKDIDSPLLLKMMTLLYVEDKTKLQKNSKKFALYEKIVEMKKHIVDDKGKIVSSDRDRCKAKMTIWEIHQIYALKLLYKMGFEDSFNDNKMIDINEFQLLKRWMKEKSKWTPEAISRYGFLIVDNWNTDDEFPDFVHRTFAEFFVTQFTIQDLYELDDDDEISENDIKLRMNLLIKMEFHSESETYNFISSFIESNDPKYMHKHFYNLVTSNEIQKLILQRISASSYLIRIFSIDKRFLKEFRFEGNISIYQYALSEINVSLISDIIEIYKHSLGADWINHTGYSVKDDFPMPIYEKIIAPSKEDLLIHDGINEEPIEDEEINDSSTEYSTDDEDIYKSFNPDLTDNEQANKSHKNELVDDESKYDSLKRESSKYKDSDKIYSEIKEMYKLLKPIDHLAIPQNDLSKFIGRNFFSICDKIFKSSEVRYLLMKIIEDNIVNDKNEFLREIMENVIFLPSLTVVKDNPLSAPKFIENAKIFIHQLKEFLQLDEKNFFLTFDLYFFGMKSVMDSYEAHDFKKCEIQEFFINYSVEIIDCMSNFRFDVSIEDFIQFFKKNFNNSEKIQLKKFFEMQFERKRSETEKHTVLSYLDVQIKNHANNLEAYRKLNSFKFTLRDLARKI